MDEKGFDYINIIPFVDIMLVLLTIVLTTSTFVAVGSIPVELPRATKNQNEALRTQTIEIDAGGGIYLNANPVSLDGLRCSIKTMNKDVPILIRADRKIALQVFVGVLDTVKTLEFRKVSLQTEGKT